MAGALDRQVGSSDFSDPWSYLELERKANQQRVRPNELNVLPINLSTNSTVVSPGVEEDADVSKHVGPSVSIATLIAEHLLSHPFVVLRRQCQVHHNSKANHTLAITLVPVIVRLHKNQGFTTLWKGLGSSLLIKGMSLAIEDLLSKVTPWPKEITWHSSLKTLSQHILLKSVSLAFMTPFYSASLVETVQSDIASEKPGVFDVFKGGMFRLVRWGTPQKGRMLPVWALIFPTVVCGLLRYLLKVVVQNVASRAIHLRNRFKQEKRGALHKDIISKASNEEIENTSSFIGSLSADVICYPLETILHRLYLQGTRTIVDNLDSGMGVIPILTNYEGMVDCYESTISQEGVLGLYKGFGALVFQYAVQWAVIKLTKFFVTEISILLKSNSKVRRVPPDQELLMDAQPSVKTPQTKNLSSSFYAENNPPYYSFSYPSITPM
ncbi:conserved hypothetical protein [Pediculus humanus corporis]|uniref:Solute carrier family 25 member 46 n=1 Tax=Pediculus humanus subsp. corporis TaxID=121224 RepID=E0VRK5_PEDHC|nr:uncharacterized protein Phum_PHUM399570 [Pediculus humanus corporis]EEB16011.1 conserved hypothetical protein [Pediculus humanus corporis]